MEFFWCQGIFFLNLNFKNGCKNEFQDNNEKSWSWFINGVSQKIDFRADGTHESQPTAWELKIFFRLQGTWDPPCLSELRRLRVQKKLLVKPRSHSLMKRLRRKKFEIQKTDEILKIRRENELKGYFSYEAWNSFHGKYINKL